MIIKNETVRLNDADSIARLPGKPPVRSHSTMHSSLREILLELRVHDVPCVDVPLSPCKEGLSSQCLLENRCVSKES